MSAKPLKHASLMAIFIFGGCGTDGMPDAFRNPFTHFVKADLMLFLAVFMMVGELIVGVLQLPNCLENAENIPSPTLWPTIVANAVATAV